MDNLLATHISFCLGEPGLREIVALKVAGAISEAEADRQAFLLGEATMAEALRLVGLAPVK